jgi:uncharacterized protein YndB with AHSA1/START domain
VRPLPPIRITRSFAALPAVVFEALTDARQVARWSGGAARIGRRLGGRFEMFDGWATGRVVVYRPPSRFACTWRVDGWRPAWDNSLVEWRLTRVPRGTRVELLHSFLPTAGEARAHKAGWDEYVFEPLREYLNTKR